MHFRLFSISFLTLIISCSSVFADRNTSFGSWTMMQRDKGNRCSLWNYEKLENKALLGDNFLELEGVYGNIHVFLTFSKSSKNPNGSVGVGLIGPKSKNGRPYYEFTDELTMSVDDGSIFPFIQGNTKYRTYGYLPNNYKYKRYEDTLKRGMQGTISGIFRTADGKNVKFMSRVDLSGFTKAITAWHACGT